MHVSSWYTTLSGTATSPRRRCQITQTRHGEVHQAAWARAEGMAAGHSVDTLTDGMGLTRHQKTRMAVLEVAGRTGMGRLQEVSRQTFHSANSHLRKRRDRPHGRLLRTRQ